jgi:hypothetical protein
MMKEEEKIFKPQNEITLRDLLRLVKGYSNYLKSKLFYIITIGLIFGTMFFIRHYLKLDLYSTSLTFMVNEDEGSSPNSVGSILGQFGLGGGTGEYNLEKILALSKSRKIISSAIFQKGELNGKNDFYANHLINIYSLNKKWRKSNVSMDGFSLFKNAEIEKFNKQELNALLTIEALLIGAKPLFSSDYNKRSSIMTMSLTTTNSELTVKLLTDWFKQLSLFYIEKAVEKQKNTHDLLVNKVDSIRGLLSGMEYKTVNFETTHRNLIDPRLAVPLVRYNRDKTILNLVYGEAIKNAEIADFALKSKTPFIQPIDLPIEPLISSKRGLIKNVLRGIFIGMALSSIYFILKRWYKINIDNND